MSYCRWSSDNWRSDVYCYEDCSGGFTTHVAGRRVVGDIPQLLPFPAADDDAGISAWMAAHQAQMDFMDTCERAPIGLPHDGESFNDPDEASMLARLMVLQDIGYHVPAYVIGMLMAEVAASKDAQ